MLTVNAVKSVKFPAVNVYKSNYIAPAQNGNDNFAARQAAAGDVSRKLLNIGNDDAFLALPRCPAHSPSERNSAACDRTLKRPQYQLITFDNIKSCPPESECTVKKSSDVGHICNAVILSLDKGFNLLIDKAILVSLRLGVHQNSPSKNILPCRLIGEKWGKLFTNCLFAALGAGLEPFGNTALAHFTQTGTEICLNTFCPAAQAVDMLRLDFVRIVPLAPQFRCFCAEFIIIVDGCDSGIAQFAVETAMSNQFFCHIVFVFSAAPLHRFRADNREYNSLYLKDSIILTSIPGSKDGSSERSVSPVKKPLRLLFRERNQAVEPGFAVYFNTGDSEHKGVRCAGIDCKTERRPVLVCDNKIIFDQIPIH